MNSAELKSALEAIIYAADEPATLEQLAGAVGEEKHLVRAALDELVASFATDDRGVKSGEPLASAAVRIGWLAPAASGNCGASALIGPTSRM